MPTARRVRSRSARRSAARPRSGTCPTIGASTAFAHGLEAERVATRRELGEHLLHRHRAEHLGRGEVLIGRDRDLTRAVDRSHPRTTDRDLASAEGDRAVLVSVTDGCALGVVAALRPAQGGDALLEDRVHHLQPGADREREQSFAELVGEVGHRDGDGVGHGNRARPVFFVW